ncbi:MAG TPA: hypothetical protein VGL56_19240 [Fimbriimonadaceae bacterium]|jgi:hypothetical protein
MKNDPAEQTRKQSLSGKDQAAENLKTMQPERKISRAGSTSDSQQGQSEADRQQAADENKH